MRLDKIEIWRARSVDGRETPALIIAVLNEVPENYDDSRLDIAFESDSSELESALYYSLPSGTYNKLLAAMLIRTAKYAIAQGEIDNGQNEKS